MGSILLVEEFGEIQIINEQSTERKKALIKFKLPLDTVQN